MMDFKVEYVQERNLSTLPWSAADRSTPVVRLAEVETLIQEAELFAKNVMRNGRWQEDEWYKAQAFLASVAAWRERQKGTS